MPHAAIFAICSRAVALGDIARLRAGRGEVDQALELQHERLEENRQLGDLDGQAAALWGIAQRGNVIEAAPRIAEALPHRRPDRPARRHLRHRPTAWPDSDG